MNPRADFIKESERLREAPAEWRTFDERVDAFHRKHPEFFSNDPTEISKFDLYELWRTQRTQAQHQEQRNEPQSMFQRDEVDTSFGHRLEFQVFHREEYDRWRDKSWMINDFMPRMAASRVQQRRGQILNRASSALRDDEEVVHTVVTQIQKNLQYASER